MKYFPFTLKQSYSQLFVLSFEFKLIFTRLNFIKVRKKISILLISKAGK